MNEDPIVEEVRRAREQYCAQFDYDLSAMCEDLRRRTEEAARAGRKVMPLPPRRPERISVLPKKLADPLASYRFHRALSRGDLRMAEKSAD